MLATTYKLLIRPQLFLGHNRASAWSFFSENMIGSVLPKNMLVCEFFIRSCCYTYLENPLDQEKKHIAQFFRASVHFRDQNGKKFKNRKIILSLA